jgi:hypothetical protein
MNMLVQAHLRSPKSIAIPVWQSASGSQGSIRIQAQPEVMERALIGYQIRVHSKRERSPVAQPPPSSLPMINRRKARSSLCSITPNRRRGGGKCGYAAWRSNGVGSAGELTLRGDGSVYPCPRVMLCSRPLENLSSFAPFPRCHIYHQVNHH